MKIDKNLVDQYRASAEHAVGSGRGEIDYVLDVHVDHRPAAIRAYRNAAVASYTGHRGCGQKKKALRDG